MQIACSFGWSCSRQWKCILNWLLFWILLCDMDRRICNLYDIFCFVAGDCLGGTKIVQRKIFIFEMIFTTICVFLNLQSLLLKQPLFEFPLLFRWLLHMFAGIKIWHFYHFALEQWFLHSLWDAGWYDVFWLKQKYDKSAKNALETQKAHRKCGKWVRACIRQITWKAFGL